MPRKKNPAKRTFRVKMMRPLFQIAVIEVDALEARDAVAAALDKADMLPDTSWCGIFDAASYTYDVQDVVEVGKSSGKAPDQEEWEPSDELRYLVLKGDIECGEGEVIAQPWFVHENDLMVADIAGDWAEALETIREKGFKAYIAELVQEHGLANVVKREGDVIPFRASASDKDEDE
jgi:hypothetical protein